MSNESVIKFLADFLDAERYNNIVSENAPIKNFKLYNENCDLWHDILNYKLSLTKTVKLTNFCIMEWLPVSPGLYFTHKASQSRTEAEQMMDWFLGEYVPTGKLRMIEGGIGSVRLSPDSNNNYYLGASSTGISHQGIPLMLSRDLYSAYIDIIKEEGYIIADIVGTIEFLSKARSLIEYKNKIPRYIISVDSIKLKKLEPINISVSIATLFSEHTQTNSKYYTYASFSPDNAGNNLKSAVEWIEDYAYRYSMKTGAIHFLSDFDEHMQHFSFPVDIALHSVMNSKINQAYLYKLCETLNITLMENNISGNSGPVAVGNEKTIISTGAGDISISNSFNERYGEGSSDVLKKVIEIINQEKNDEAKELFQEFKEQLEKEKPKKSMLQMIWSNIVSLVPLIKASTDIYDKVESMIKAI